MPMFICIYIYTAKNLKNLCHCIQICENALKYFIKNEKIKILYKYNI